MAGQSISIINFLDRYFNYEICCIFFSPWSSSAGPPYNFHLAFQNKKSYYENGQIENELILENKKKYLYIYNEYYSNGSIKLKGHIKYDMGIFDYVKYGTWLNFDKQGNGTTKDHY